ncbi:MAG: c-type cytochrome [Bacteroidetes bacterium]|nr:MAG: c-type cytochrome [Bacteroidota bacterium]
MKKWIVVVGVLSFVACQPDRFEESTIGPDVTYIDFPTPDNFPAPSIPGDNPTTEEGVRLGRHLFYDKRLSDDNTLACAGCHFQDFGFADFNATSTGIDGVAGDMNAMVLFNLAWQDHFFWDGRSPSLEAQAIEPVINPIEMHTTWDKVLMKLESDSAYQYMFNAAFGSNSFTKENAAKAIAQFERMLISSNSKFDQYLKGQYQFTPEEQLGYTIFSSERGDCFHCHGDAATGNLFGAFGTLQFSNNGLDSILTPGSGREGVTGDTLDRAKFKIPSLRNVEYTYPYMHDGRFQNLFQVLEHYNSGGHSSYTLDPNMKNPGESRNWTQQEKDALLAFLYTLSDPTFLTDTAFADPFE